MTSQWFTITAVKKLFQMCMSAAILAYITETNIT